MSLDELRERLADTCRAHLDREAAGLVTSLARPAVRLTRAADDARCRTRLGGRPRLDSDTPWPTGPDGTPLDALCTVDVAELAPFETDVALPASGSFSVFYDAEGQPWGNHPTDHESWSVIWSEQPVDRPLPPGVEPFTEVGLAPSQMLTIPGWEEPALEPVVPPFSDRSPAATLARERFFALEEAWDAVIGRPSPDHRVGGWPALQQAPIWRGLDRMTERLALDANGDSEAARSGLSDEQTSEWALLMQIDTDDDAGWMWGDVGTLYVACRRPINREGRPLRTWIVLQCG